MRIKLANLEFFTRLYLQLLVKNNLQLSLLSEFPVKSNSSKIWCNFNTRCDCDINFKQGLSITKQKKGDCQSVPIVAIYDAILYFVTFNWFEALLRLNVGSKRNPLVILHFTTYVSSVKSKFSINLQLSLRKTHDSWAMYTHDNIHALKVSSKYFMSTWAENLITNKAGSTNKVSTMVVTAPNK